MVHGQMEHGTEYVWINHVLAFFVLKPNIAIKSFAHVKLGI